MLLQKGSCWSGSLIIIFILSIIFPMTASGQFLPSPLSAFPPGLGAYPGTYPGASPYGASPYGASPYYNNTFSPNTRAYSSAYSPYRATNRYVPASNGYPGANYYGYPSAPWAAPNNSGPYPPTANSLSYRPNTSAYSSASYRPPQGNTSYFTPYQSAPYQSNQYQYINSPNRYPNQYAQNAYQNNYPYMNSNPYQSNYNQNPYQSSQGSYNPYQATNYNPYTSNPYTSNPYTSNPYTSNPYTTQSNPYTSNPYTTQNTQQLPSVDEALNENNNGAYITVNEGDTIGIVLTSNPSTGYHWILDSVELDDDIVKKVSNNFYSIQSNPSAAVGSGGKELWIFTAEGTGDTPIKLEYTSPSGNIDQTFEVTIGVN